MHSAPDSSGASQSAAIDHALTPREDEVATLLRLGLSNKAIAERLGIGVDTARRYSSRVKHKTQVRSLNALPGRTCASTSSWLEALDLRGFQLSVTEMQVLRLLSDGYSSKEIARVMQTSPRTIDKHREHLLYKFAANSTREMIAWLASQYAKCGMEFLLGDS